jgi:hypothetical protein
MGFNSAWFVAQSFNAAMFGPNVALAAAEAERLAAEEEHARELMHFRARLHRERARQALVPASTEAQPTPEPAPIPPDPERVAQLASNAEECPPDFSASPAAWGPGIVLPPT